jgi:CIC family chloride channel protein
VSLTPSSIRSILQNLDHRVQLVIIGIIVGIFSGFAALGLNFALESVAHLLTGVERTIHMVLPGLGIFLTVVFLKHIVRDFRGHGVPDVIFSVGMRGGLLKLRSSFSRLIGSLLTIASGGSAGPEAPVVISGAAIGSNIATYFKSTDRIRIASAGSGAAAAIAAIFNAPIAGIIFTMEVIIGEWSALNMLPVAIASVTGTIISRFFNGNQIPFGHQLINVSLNDIVASVGLLVFTTIFALLFIKFLKWTSRSLAKIIGSDLLKAVIGGLLVGVLIRFFPHVGGEGYGVVRTLIAGRFSGVVLVVCLLIILKILATSITLGAGGAGGVFAPSLVIGSLTGFFYFHLLTIVFPQAQFSGAPLFALCGMAGILSGTLQAPLTGIFLIVEITGGYDVILPLLVVSFLTATLVKLVEHHSVYQYELAEKGLLLRPRTDAGILVDMKTEELLERDLVTVYPEMVLNELIPLIEKSSRNFFPVLDRQTGKFLGMVNFADIKSCVFNPVLVNSVIVEEVMQSHLTRVSIDDSVIDILDKFDRSGAFSLPVVKGDQFMGLISKATLLDHYRKELKAQTDL